MTTQEATMISQKIYDDELEKAISMMLKENTGEHLCDSGGAYGRQYQICAKDDFSKLPESTLELSNDGGITVSNHLYHYLINYLDITEESKQLEKDLWKLICSNDDYYGENIDEWCEKLFKDGFDYTIDDETERGRFKIITSGYTYNEENCLNRDFVYTFIRQERWGEIFVVIQTHNGCDARGGFSSPHVFALKDGDSWEDMMVAMHYFEIIMYDRENDVYNYYSSENAGYTWDKYEDDGIAKFDEYDMGKLIIKEIFGNKESFDTENVNIDANISDTWIGRDGESKTIWIAGSLGSCHIEPRIMEK